MKTLLASTAALTLLAAAATAQDMGMSFDGDGDGLSSMTEFDEGLGTAGLYTSMDANEDGLLTEDEYGDNADDFATYDADASGDLSEEEFNAGLFGSYDADGSGDLDENEVATADADFAEGGRFFMDDMDGTDS